MRLQEYPEWCEKDMLHNHLELQRWSTQCSFLCPKQPTSLNSELFWGTHIKAEAHSNSFNGWICFCIHLWNMDLDFRLEPPVINTASCHKSLAQEVNLLSSHRDIFRCPTLFNFCQNTPGLFRFGDLCLCSDISSHFQTNNHSTFKMFLPADPRMTPQTTEPMEKLWDHLLCQLCGGELLW